MKYILICYITIVNCFAWETITIVPSDKIISIDGQSLYIQNFPATVDCVAIKVNKEDGILIENKNGQERNKDFDLSPYIQAWNYEKEKRLNPPPKIEIEESKESIINIMLDAKIKLQFLTLELSEDPTNQDLRNEKSRLENLYLNYKKKLKK